jgi:hypothetical protein
MIAGVAALGATAIAITPITQPDLLPSAQRAAASIELSSFDSPITAISQVVEDVNTNIFSNATGFGNPWDTDPNFPLIYLGVIPDFLDWPLPALTTAGINLSGYGWAAIRGVGDFGAKALQAAWNTPSAAVEAAQLALDGKTQEALDLLQAQIVLPLQKGVNSLLNSAEYILTNVVKNAGFLLIAPIPDAIVGLVSVTIGGATFVAKAAVDTLQASFDELSQGHYDTAWNIAVAGFLGRQGTLGWLEKLTLGPGIAVGSDVIPSYRTLINSVAQSFPFNQPYDPTQGSFQPSSAAVKPSSQRQTPAAATFQESSPTVEKTVDNNVPDSSVADVEDDS